MRDYADRIEKKDALQAHPEYLNEQINDHDKAIYAKGWNDCNKEYYNAITELPVASIACTDISMRLRRTFEADELVNQRILLDAADAIEELLDELTTIRKQFPHWISVEELLAERTAFWADTQPHLDDSSYKKDGMSYYCSNCHHRAGKYKHRSYKFCPWCGAKIVPKEMAVRNED